MVIQAIPKFKAGAILRQEMLQALFDQAYLANQLIYKGYSNGVLSGCALTTTMDAIIINEGIIFFEGQMYLFKEPVSVNYYPTNTTTVLKIKFSDEINDEAFSYREVDISLTEQTRLLKDELELCRFKLQDGARLRYEYQDFEDRDTEFDTLNVIYAAYSAKGKSTLAPEILYNFASELLELEQLSDLDVLFCTQLMGQDRPLHKKAIVTYLQRRNKMTLSDTSNYAIYYELLRVLENEKNGRKVGERTPERKKWKMIVE